LVRSKDIIEYLRTKAVDAEIVPNISTIGVLFPYGWYPVKPRFYIGDHIGWAEDPVSKSTARMVGAEGVLRRTPAQRAISKGGYVVTFGNESDDEVEVIPEKSSNNSHAPTSEDVEVDLTLAKNVGKLIVYLRKRETLSICPHCRKRAQNGGYDNCCSKCSRTGGKSHTDECGYRVISNFLDDVDVGIFADALSTGFKSSGRSEKD
jgi:hypothetical protein